MKKAAVIGGLCGLALGAGGVHAGERLRLDTGPAGWRLEHPDVPVRLARLAGPPRLPGDGWPLDSHGLLTRDLPGVDGVEVVADLPEGGQLELRLGQADSGVALVLSRVGEGLAAVAMTDREHTAPVGPAPPRRWLDCEGTLAVPGDGPVAVGLAVDRGRVTARVGDSESSCTVRRAGPAATGRVGLRAGLRRVGLHSITPTGQPAQEAPGPAWALRVLGGLLGAGLGAGAVLMANRRGLRPGLVALTLLPWLLVPWLAASDLAAGLQAARISADQPLAWALGLPLGLSGALMLVLFQARLVRETAADGAGAAPGSRALLGVLGAAVGLPSLVAIGLPGLLVVAIGVALALLLPPLLSRLGPAADRATGGALTIALVAGLAAWAAGPHFGVAVPLAQGAALLLALLVWVNVRTVRGFNLLSLALVVGALSFAEQALTWTATGMSLVGVSSRAAPAGDPGRGADDAGAPAPGAADDLGTAFRSFEALDNVRQFQRYPIQDYPVEPPPRSAPLRIAALGSSSTAGAYQNDDVDEFWPADLDRLLGPDVQVVNQGVGGWTSLHVRRYVETRPEVLDADILVLYLGHNDLLTESPRPYRQLYAAWQAGGTPSTVLSDLLGDVRLYQLLRFSLQAIAGVGVGPAVPIDDARDNLATIADLQQQRGGRVLLVTEGLAPDPSVMQPYADLMADLAAAPHVAFLDGGALLGDPARSGLFLDDCHLTRQGHELLAEAVAAALRGEGWVE